MTKNQELHSNERRCYDRLKKKFKIRYCLADKLSENHYDLEGEVLDISPSGIRFLSSGKFSKNTQLVMLLEFHGWDIENNDWIATGMEIDCSELTIIGMVMWSSPSLEHGNTFEVGVRFSGRVVTSQKHPICPRSDRPAYPSV